MNLKEAIKYFEGLRLEAYRDSGGVLTIGYGHTGKDVTVGKRITITEADALLDKDIANAQYQIKQILPTLSGHKLESVTDFVFNLGIGKFKKSTLCKKIKENADILSIQAEFRKWVFCNGRKLGGLVTRRDWEADNYAL